MPCVPHTVLRRSHGSRTAASLSAAARAPFPASVRPRETLTPLRTCEWPNKGCTASGRLVDETQPAARPLLRTYPHPPDHGNSCVGMFGRGARESRSRTGRRRWPQPQRPQARPPSPPPPLQRGAQQAATRCQPPPPRPARRRTWWPSRRCARHAPDRKDPAAAAVDISAYSCRRPPPPSSPSSLAASTARPSSTAPCTPRTPRGARPPLPQLHVHLRPRLPVSTHAPPTRPFVRPSRWRRHR